MDLDDEDEARLDALQGDRDAIPSGADATTTLWTMTMTSGDEHTDGDVR